MSLYDKASLIMTPSGAKATKLYSHKPYNGNGDFTHDRNAGTATRVNKDGYIETVAADVPRLDYPLIDGVVQDCPVLLLEPATTNQLQYSEDFTQSEWSKSNVNTPVLQTSVIAPDGTTNVYLLTNSANSNPLLYDDQIGSSTNDSTFSVFVKYYNTRYLVLRVDLPTKRVLFDIQEGYIVDENSGVNGSIKNYGNGWYRCSITHTTITSSNNAVISVNDSGSITDSTTSTTGLGYYIFGAQYEVNSYPTSYIPNDGTTATVTRNADVCDSAGTSAEFNDSEGVLYAEFSALEEIPTTNEHIVLRNSASTDFSNSILIQHRNDGNLRIYVDGFDAGTMQFVVTNINWLVNNKIAIQYDSIGSNYKLFLNGTSKARYSTAANQSVVGLNDISFYWGSVNNPLYGKVKEVATFKTALTDSELEQLTSWDSFTEMAKSQEYSIK